IDPLLLCEVIPEYSAVIMASGKIAWAKSSLVYYVSVLERNAAVRNAEAVIEHALAGIRNASSGEAAAGALKSAQDAMAAISLTPDTVQPAHIDEILPAVVDRVDARYQGLEEAKLLMTGIEELDAKTGGIEPTDLVIIAARPSMGKTELALDIIDKVSEQGHGVLFFSMEMPGIQIGERMVSAAGGMPVSRLKAAAKFKDEDWARLSTGIGHLTGRNIWMVDATDLTLEQIQKTATSHQIAHPEIALVVIDYLLLIKIQSTTRYDLAVGEISKGLKRLARTNRTPVLALSQLSR
ncbi:replicative DNA helicase, partial [Salmonella enterica]|nr:replicative DNA helicase [Salmonella enterica]